ncbi:hypothetical protein WICPIJ_008424 [Wickerhamomyces pijperi]|uniref:Uncharacterized protein n=1 Tax=Wickerhamomyces pijperi TaxID=599730 RepID=A0A9P8THR3_WICPI|nr:hypothetical protein WICPIJ_008424 [Wickerhamomyces pijperi]
MSNATVLRCGMMGNVSEGMSFESIYNCGLIEGIQYPGLHTDIATNDSYIIAINGTNVTYPDRSKSGASTAGSIKNLTFGNVLVLVLCLAAVFI